VFCFPKEIWDKVPDGVKQKITTRVRIVETNISRIVHGVMQGVELSVPDYEKEINQMCEENDDPFIIHGVRLPTKT